MHELIKNLRHKDYNLCGELTGKERELCSRALEESMLLSFEKVMRSALAKMMSELERAGDFKNRAALENWADYNLNDVEGRVVIKFETSSRLQIGLAKYLTHVLYENRYNIHYNALVNHCREYFENVFKDKSTENLGFTAEELESKIDSLAQEADYSSRYMGLRKKLSDFFSGGVDVGSVLSDILNALF